MFDMLFVVFVFSFRIFISFKGNFCSLKLTTFCILW